VTTGSGGRDRHHLHAAHRAFPSGGMDGANVQVHGIADPQMTGVQRMGGRAGCKIVPDPPAVEI